MGFLRRALNRFLSVPERTPLPAPPAGETFTRRVMLVIYDPAVAEQGGRSLRDVLGWADPDVLVGQFVADLKQASGGYCDYQVVRRLRVDALPRKVDGFVYRPADYLAAWRARSGFHQPDWADYEAMLAEHEAVPLFNAGEIDELWLFGPPYGGFYESRMAGPGAFWCNSPPMAGPASLGRRFVIMGFNYERGVGEMLEAYGHRAESILAKLFEGRRRGENLWERYTRHEKSHPGRSEVGTIHFAPNSERDYDWGNRTPVISYCDNWYRFPDLSGPARLVDCREWGEGDIRLHHRWWFNHLPQAAGASDGIDHNWWSYIMDPNRVV